MVLVYNTATGYRLPYYTILSSVTGYVKIRKLVGVSLSHAVSRAVSDSLECRRLSGGHGHYHSTLISLSKRFGMWSSSESSLSGLE